MGVTLRDGTTRQSSRERRRTDNTFTRKRSGGGGGSSGGGGSKAPTPEEQLTVAQRTLRQLNESAERSGSSVRYTLTQAADGSYQVTKTSAAPAPTPAPAPSRPTFGSFSQRLVASQLGSVGTPATSTLTAPRPEPRKNVFQRTAAGVGGFFANLDAKEKTGLVAAEYRRIARFGERTSKKGRFLEQKGVAGTLGSRGFTGELAGPFQQVTGKGLQIVGGAASQFGERPITSAATFYSSLFGGQALGAGQRKIGTALATTNPRAATVFKATEKVVGTGAGVALADQANVAPEQVGRATPLLAGFGIGYYKGAATKVSQPSASSVDLTTRRLVVSETKGPGQAVDLLPGGRVLNPKRTGTVTALAGEGGATVRSGDRITQLFFREAMAAQTRGRLTKARADTTGQYASARIEKIGIPEAGYTYRLGQLEVGRLQTMGRGRIKNYGDAEKLLFGSRVTRSRLVEEGLVPEFKTQKAAEDYLALVATGRFRGRGVTTQDYVSTVQNANKQLLAGFGERTTVTGRLGGEPYGGTTITSGVQASRGPGTRTTSFSRDSYVLGETAFTRLRKYNAQTTRLVQRATPRGRRGSLGRSAETIPKPRPTVERLPNNLPSPADLFAKTFQATPRVSLGGPRFRTPFLLGNPRASLTGQSPRQEQPAPRKPGTTPRFEEILGFEPGQRTTPTSITGLAQTPSSKQRITTPPTPVPRLPTPTTVPSLSPPFPPLLPPAINLPGGGLGGRRSRGGASRQRKAYIPNLTGIERGVLAKNPKATGYSGFEVRGLTAKQLKRRRSRSYVF